MVIVGKSVHTQCQPKKQVNLSKIRTAFFFKTYKNLQGTYITRKSLPDEAKTD
jgi:hypothetical protein